MDATPTKITPCLWFNFNAEEAVNHYLNIFKHSRILETSRYDASMPEYAGKVLMIVFEIEGQRLQALNGGPQFPFSEAISLSVSCEDQAEVDDLWSKLTAEGGRESMCGWLKDKYGLSWQIVPRQVVALFNHADKAGAMRAMKAMLGMRKLDIAAIQRAFDGR
ncbi:MAG: VOC family protein [Burkholderiales bacterium]|nr:VOC family protein [Burkholderiales bacterium]